MLNYMLNFLLFCLIFYVHLCSSSVIHPPCKLFIVHMLMNYSVCIFDFLLYLSLWCFAHFIFNQIIYLCVKFLQNKKKFGSKQIIRERAKENNNPWQSLSGHCKFFAPTGKRQERTVWQSAVFPVVSIFLQRLEKKTR